MKSLRLLATFLVASLLPLAATAQVYNQVAVITSTPSTLVAPATPAVTTAKSSAGYLTFISCGNILATPVYVKVWDAASVTLGTTSATYQFMCPGNTAGAGFVLFAGAIAHANAIKYAVTGAISLTDNTAITATSVTVNVGFN